MTAKGNTIENVFRILDSNNDGMISPEEFERVLKAYNVPLNQSQISSFLKAIHKNETGEISLAEFRNTFELRMQIQKDSKELIGQTYNIPRWLEPSKDNVEKRTAIFQIYKGLKDKGYSSLSLLRIYDASDSGKIDSEKFKKCFTSMLGSAVEPAKIDKIIEAMDPRKSGRIDYREFSEYLSPTIMDSIEAANKLDSTAVAKISKVSLKYILHKSFELNIDLYQIIEELDTYQTGGIAITKFIQLLLSYPLGLTADDLEKIVDQECTFDYFGNIDYMSIFTGDEYRMLRLAAIQKQKSLNNDVEDTARKAAENKKKLEEEKAHRENKTITPVAAPAKPQAPKIPVRQGTLKELVATPENKNEDSFFKEVELTRTADSVIVEDMYLIPRLQLVAYTVIKPLTATIFLKTTEKQNKLLAELVGHKSKSPPCIAYIENSGCLLSGDRYSESSRMPAEILVWNLQEDLVTKYSIHPPWNINPCKRINAHEGCIFSLSYLQQSQVVVSAGSDQKVKFWNVVGTRYQLTEPSFTPERKRKHGYYFEGEHSFTKTNRFFSLMDTFESIGMPYVLQPIYCGNIERLMTLELNPRGDQGILNSYNCGRFKIQVPAIKHDTAVPKSVLFKFENLLKQRSEQNTESIQKKCQQEKFRLEQKQIIHTEIHSRVSKYLKDISLFQSEKSVKALYSELIRLWEGEINVENLYSLLEDYNMVTKIPFAKFKSLSDEIYKRLYPLSSQERTPRPSFSPRITNSTPSLKTNVSAPPRTTTAAVKPAEKDIKVEEKKFELTTPTPSAAKPAEESKAATAPAAAKPGEEGKDKAAAAKTTEESKEKAAEAVKPEEKKTELTQDAKKDKLVKLYQSLNEVLVERDYSLQDAFLLFDNSGQGTVSVDEFKRALDLFELTDHIIGFEDIVIEAFAPNGKFDYPRFTDLVKSPPIDEAHWRSCFEKLDPDTLRNLHSFENSMITRLAMKNLTTDMMPYHAFESYIKEIGVFYPNVVTKICEASAEGTRGALGSLKNSARSLSSSRSSYNQDKINTKQFLESVRLIPTWTRASQTLSSAQSGSSGAMTKVPSEKELAINAKQAKALEQERQLGRQESIETPKEPDTREVYYTLANQINELNLDIARVFVAVDTDGSGAINKAEFWELVKLVGFEDVSESQIGNIFSRLDSNSDGHIHFDEFEKLLKKFGYIEPTEKHIYRHKWGDYNLNEFTKAFERLQLRGGYKSLYALLKAYDINKDGLLTYPELKQAVYDVMLDHAKSDGLLQRIIQRLPPPGILLVNDIENALHEMQLMNRQNEVVEYSIKEDQFEEIMQKINVLAEFSQLVKKTGSNVKEIQKKCSEPKPPRGITLLGSQNSIQSLLQQFQKCRDKFLQISKILSVNVRDKINFDSALFMIQTEDQHTEYSAFKRKFDIPKLSSNEFEIDYESEMTFNDVRHCNTYFKESGIEGTCDIYDTEYLRYLSSDGNAMERHIHNQLDLQIAIQNDTNLQKFVGAYEKKVGVDKHLFLLYEKLPNISQSLYHLVYQTGGLLGVPIISNTNALFCIIKVWARQILEFLHVLQEKSGVMRSLNSASCYVSQDGLNISFGYLSGTGILDEEGKIAEAPELKKVMGNEFYDTSFLAPEFITERPSDHTSAVDIWSFGAILYHVLFGYPVPSYLSLYGREPEVKPAPFVNINYDLYGRVKISNDEVAKETDYIGSLKTCIDKLSFSGVINDPPENKVDTFRMIKDKIQAMTKSPRDLDELQRTYERMLNLQNTEGNCKNALGLILDVISLCLQVDPTQRPTVQGLLNSPLFDVTDYELLQVKRFAPNLLAYQNPQMFIHEKISIPIEQMASGDVDFTADELFSKIDLLESSICMGSFAPADTMATGIIEGLRSKSSSLVKRAMEDKLIHKLAYITLTHYKDYFPILERFVEFLKTIFFELYSYSSPLSLYVEDILEVLLKLLCGERSQLASDTSTTRTKTYMSEKGRWTPELFRTVSPLYLDVMGTQGTGQTYYPVVQEFIEQARLASSGSIGHMDRAGACRTPVYYSELVPLSENIVRLQDGTKGRAAKRMALKTLRATFANDDNQKLMAILDLRLPYQIIHLMQDTDIQIRSECIAILWEISQGCRPQSLLKLSESTAIHRKFSIMNFYSIAQDTTKETTQDFPKYAAIRMETLNNARVDMSKCFENPIFLTILARIFKLKSEPYENKEAVIMTFFNLLHGTEKMIFCLKNPAVDGIGLLCRALIDIRTPLQKKQVRSIPKLVKETVGRMFAKGRPQIVKAIRGTIGAEKTLSEYGIILPDPVTLPDILSRVGDMNADYALSQNTRFLVRDVQTWLQHVFPTTSLPKDQVISVISRGLSCLKDIVDLIWTVAEQITDEEYSPGVRLRARNYLTHILELFDWVIDQNLDYMWMRDDPELVMWFTDKLNLVLGEFCNFKQGSMIETFNNISQEVLKDNRYAIYPLVTHGVQLQRIVCRLFTKKEYMPLFEKIEYGSTFSEQLLMQFEHLRFVMTNHTEVTHLLHVYSVQTNLRLTQFENLLRYGSETLKRQFVHTRFFEKMIGEYLTDYRALDARFFALSLDFLPFRECVPVRGECIILLQALIQSKQYSALLYDEAVLQIKRRGIIQAELIKIKEENTPLVHTTALELLSVIVTSDEPQFEYILLQDTAHLTIRKMFENRPSFRRRFPSLIAYANKF